MNVYINPNVKNMTRVFPPQGRYGKLRYDMNENPEGLPKDFVDSVLNEITPEFLSIYPEPDRFATKYAKFIGASLENVMTTNGSDQAIRYLLQTYGEPGKKVVTVSPTFEMYWVNCCLLGLVHMPVAYEPDMTISIDKIIAAIDGDTRIAVLLNPNNPVGNVYTDEELKKVVARCKEVGAVLIIDEAYHYFYPNTFLKYALEEENVILLRTFSKCFSIAAVRLGVLISNPQLVHYARNLRLTFDVNSVALLFGERLLDHPEILPKLIGTENEGRAFILDEFKKNGYECRDCRGNFVFVTTKHDAKELAKALEDRNVLVHAYNSPLIRNQIRVSTGSVAAMQKFLDVFLERDK